MMDYSKLSDFEINREVAIKLGLKPYFDDGGYSMDGEYVVTRGPRCLGRWEPCKEAHQAWPIIVEKRIALMPDASEHGTSQWWDAQSSCQKYGVQYQANPLRAAMIVYLMMNEGKS